jgi:tetratricopeptide (TPR) repeat protein
MGKYKVIQERTSLKQKIILLIFGLSLCLVLLEGGLRLGGFIISFLQEHRNMVSFKQKGAYRIMCVGESTTAGYYPTFLEEILNGHKIGIKFSVMNVGVAGLHTSVILARLESQLNQYLPDMVVVMMGVNDWGARMPYETITTSKIILFFRDFRTYKLIRLLWLHIVTNLEEAGLYKPKIEKRGGQRTSGLQPDFLITRFEADHTQRDSSLNDESYKKVSTFSASNYWRYLGLAEFYRDHDKFSQAKEASYKKAIELNPRDPEAYIELGWFYQHWGKFLQAEESFNKALYLNPENYGAYVGLGWFYQIQGKLLQAEESYKKAIELNPKKCQAYIGLGWFYQCRANHSQAEESYKKAIELDPGNPGAYMGLGGLYQHLGKLSQARELLRKNIELNPKSYGAHIVLGWFYQDGGKFLQAEESFKKAIELNPGDDCGFTEIGWLYQNLGRLSQAEESFKKAIELNPNDDIAYGALQVLYDQMGNRQLARKYKKKTEELRLSYYDPATINNYYKLKEILDKRGIRLICMQYPMRSVESLKKIFAGENDIIFVDNEKIFKDAVKKTSYREYFVDMSAGDFGHCTKKGDRLLAGNVATVILKEFFK